MHTIVEVSNDIESGFYLDGLLLCQCERYELDVLLKALGFDYDFREAYEFDGFPENLDEIENWV